MYLLKNAIRNLGRNKGRNLLVGIITLVIIIAVSISIVISTTVGSITKDYKTRFGAEVTLFLDTDKVQKNGSVKYPSAEQQMAIARSDLLQKTEYELSLSAVLQDLKALDGDAGSNNAISSNMGDQLSLNAKVRASSQPSISEDFVSGKRAIVGGRAFEKTDECLVSEQFAQLNGLSVGDSITVISRDAGSPKPHTFTICGIYRDGIEGSALFRHPLFNRGNEIITSMESMLGMGLYAEHGEMNATYYLKDPKDLEAFQQEARAKGLPEYYCTTTDEEGYNRIVGPVEGIAGIVRIFLIVVLVFGGSILLFLSVMAVRERKYEIGVLRAMGMKRVKVIAGMVCESLVIAGVCLAVGLGISLILSQPVADILLEGQIQLAEEQQTNQSVTVIGASSDSSTGMLSEISIQLTPQAVGQIVSLALILVLISSLASILYITRYEPMKILSERS